MARARRQTLEQINQEIDSLRRMAASIRAKEIQPEILRIRKIIAKYELKPEDLFGPLPAARGRGRKAAGAATAGARPKAPPAPARYRDPEGREWSGRGRPPQWVVAARATGTLERLAV